MDIRIALFSLSVYTVSSWVFKCSLDFVSNRFFMKLCKTSDMNIVETCQLNFSFCLPSDSYFTWSY